MFLASGKFENLHRDIASGLLVFTIAYFLQAPSYFSPLFAYYVDLINKEDDEGFFNLLVKNLLKTRSFAYVKSVVLLFEKVRSHHTAQTSKLSN